MEVSYDADGTGPTQFAPDKATQEPLAYGGQFILENSEGAGGLVSTAPTIARLSTSYAVWGRGHRGAGATRYGDFAGTWTCSHSLHNGMDFAFMFNRDVPEDARDLFNWHVA